MLKNLFNSLNEKSKIRLFKKTLKTIETYNTLCGIIMLYETPIQKLYEFNVKRLLNKVRDMDYDNDFEIYAEENRWQGWGEGF